MTPLLLALLAAPPDVNLLSLEAGTVLVDGSSWDGLRTPASFADTEPGSRTSSDARPPYGYVFELEQRSALTSVDVRNTRPDGPSATTVEVWTSSAGPNDGFTRATALSLKKSGTAHAALPKETLGRWVRLVIAGNPDTLSSELIEVMVNGRPLEPSPVKSFAGSWRLQGDRAVVRLTGEGGTVSGCVAWPDQKVWLAKGTVRGRALELAWTDEVGAVAGTAVAALGDDGALRGRWRDDNGSAGTWVGLKRPDAALDCRAASDDLRFTQRLNSASTGLTLTGVGFDATTDELKLDARNELAPLERMLTKGPQTQRARLLVLGRTDGAGLADELKRCEKRAQRLLARLRQSGVPEGVVEVGIGVVRLGPVQLEPRVEVVMLSD